MSVIEQPILTIVGINKSEGDFSDNAGKSIEFSNTVVAVLQDFTEEEIKKGAIGQKSTVYKIKGGQFYHDYQNVQLPAKARLLFKLDVSGKVPKAVLVSLDFINQSYESKLPAGKTYEKSTT